MNTRSAGERGWFPGLIKEGGPGSCRVGACADLARAKLPFPNQVVASNAPTGNQPPGPCHLALVTYLPSSSVCGQPAPRRGAPFRPQVSNFRSPFLTLPSSFL